MPVCRGCDLSKPLSTDSKPATEELCLIGKEEQRSHNRKKNTFPKECVDQFIYLFLKEHMIQLINALKIFSLLQRQHLNTVLERWGNEEYLSFLIGIQLQICLHHDSSAVFDLQLILSICFYSFLFLLPCCLLVFLSNIFLLLALISFHPKSRQVKV